jgi:hypothetical protein
MQHSFLVPVLLSLGAVGCEQSQSAPPVLPALSVPLPGPPQPLLLPQRIDEKLEFIGPEGKPVQEIVCKTRATIQYRYRLPPDWTEAPDRAMCNEQTSQIVFQLIMLHKGRSIISGQGRGAPTKTA